MKRYTRVDMSNESKMMILSKIGEVVEIVGNTARIVIPGKTCGDLNIDLEISTHCWYELKEAE